MDVSVLVGKTLTSVINDGNDEIIFVTSEDLQYKMYHSQDCCENVMIDDINGDLQDLVGSPILLSEQVSNEDFEKKYAESDEGKNSSSYDSYTWTFYKLATIKGYVDIRWFGSSNGYYSESVEFELID